jgi:hypothetical protein
MTVIALEHSSVRPRFFTHSVGLILLPLAVEGGSLMSLVVSVALLFAILPLSLIILALIVNFPAMALRKVIFPVAFIIGFVLEQLSSESVFFSLKPLTFVNGVVEEHIRLKYWETLIHFISLKSFDFTNGFQDVFIFYLWEHLYRLGLVFSWSML